MEYDRLLSLLPEKLKTQFDNGFTKCLETKFFLNEAAVKFKGDIIFPITDEQVDCGRVSTIFNSIKIRNLITFSFVLLFFLNWNRVTYFE